MAGDEHHVGVELARFLGKREAAPVGKHQVEQDDIRALTSERQPCFGERERGGDGEALRGNQLGHRRRGLGVVFDDQGVTHGVAAVAAWRRPR